MHFKKFPSHKQATPFTQHSLSAAVDKNRLFTTPNENVPPYTAHIGVVSASTLHTSPLTHTHTAHCTHTLVARSQTTFTRRERVWNDAYKWLVQNSPRTGRSIIAFLVKAVWLHETTPPSHSTRHWQCWCTVQSALPRRAPDLSNAGLSLHILHSLLEDSDEGARWDLPTSTLHSWVWLYRECTLSVILLLRYISLFTVHEVRNDFLNKIMAYKT